MSVFMAANDVIQDRLHSVPPTSSRYDQKSGQIMESARTRPAIPILVGDYEVRLLPKYRRRRRIISRRHRTPNGASPEMTSSTKRRRLRDVTNKMLMPFANLIHHTDKCNANDDGDDEGDHDVINIDNASTSELDNWRNSNASVVGQAAKLSSHVSNFGDLSPERSLNPNGGEHLFNDNYQRNTFTNNGHYELLSPMNCRRTFGDPRRVGVESVDTDLVDGKFEDVSMMPTSPWRSPEQTRTVDSALNVRLSSISHLALHREHDPPPTSRYDAVVLTTTRCAEPDRNEDEDDEEWRRDEPLLSATAVRVDHSISKPEAVDDRFHRKLISRDMTSTGRQGRRVEQARAISLVVRERCDPYEWSRKVLGFLASTVGLTCLLVGYTALGGCLFVRLEGQNDLKVESNMIAKRGEYVELLWTMTERLNVLHKENWTELAEHILDAYSKHVFEATKRHGWDGRNDVVSGTNGTGSSEQWSFAGAMLFSITVITTIGYGHITPKTSLGRLATIIYAVVGIPLTLLTITQLGSIMATLFRFIYKNIDAICWQTICQRLRSRRRCTVTSNNGCCCRLRSCARHMKNRNSSKCRRDIIVADITDTGDQEKNGSESVRHNSVSDQIEDRPENEIMLQTLETKTSASEHYDFSNFDDAMTMEDELCRKMVAASKTKADVDEDDVMVVVDDDERVDDECETMLTGSIDEVTLQQARWTRRLRSRILIAFADVDEVRVPAWVCLLLVVGYIALGAVVFSVWESTGDEDEPDWNFLVGCYFCFVTLSTIGFGDYVPGTRHVTDNGQEKLVLCAFYLLIGLALQAMCFQLIQEDVRRAVTSLGVRLGLIRKDD